MAGTQRGANVMYAFEFDGVRVAHLGDLGQSILRGEQATALGQVDLLFVPVGDGPTIGASLAHEVATTLGARWVVPMHYRTARTNFLEPADAFLERFEQVARPGSSFEARGRGRGRRRSRRSIAEVARPVSMCGRFDAMEALMAKVIYTAKATVTGGRQLGHGVSDDGALDVQLRPPTDGGGTNPEQLFAVGYAACFEGAIGAIGRRQRLEVGDVSIDCSVSLSPTEERGFKLGVELDVTLPQLDEDAAEQVVRAAHLVCPYSNATRGNIDVKLIANGRALD